MARRAVAIAPWIKLVREPSRYPVNRTRVRGARDVAALVGPRMATEEVEVFLLLCLNASSEVTHLVEVSRGILNATLATPREVFAPAIVARASGVILAHNHPSGSLDPSVDDVTMAHQLVQAGKLLDIPVYDHLIVATPSGSPGVRFCSFAERGLL